MQVQAIYSVRLDEAEVGNRTALYKATRFMGLDSDHAYPSQEQMPYMAVKNASGGGVTDPLVPTVDASGVLGVAPKEAAAPNAAHSYHVATQAKLKIRTIVLAIVIRRDGDGRIGGDR